MGRRHLLLIGLLLTAACGDVTRDGAALPVAGPVLVPEGQVAVVRPDRSVATVGAQPQRLGRLPDDAGEPDAVAVGRDGRLVLVSAVRWDDDDSAVCSATVLQVLADGELRQLVEGASVALSPDDGRIAYFRHATVDGYCRRTALVVRDLASGSERTVLSLQDAPVGATPPDWPVSWSPDGRRLAHVLAEGAVVTDVATGATEPATEALAQRALAPVWLADGTLLLLDGCCIGPGRVRTAAGAPVFEVPGPVRSIRPARTGAGAWLAVEGAGLYRWDGAAARPVDRDVLLTSG